MTTNTNPQGIRAGIAGIKSSIAGLFDAAKVLKTLGINQVKDEVQIAKHELKTKGVALGKGAAFLAVAAVFACFMVIAIIGLLIFLLGQLVPLWASALIWAGVFLIILAILGLIGYKKVKAQLPFAPESAIFGVLFDLGVLREGSAMTASRLKQEQAERAARKQAEREAAAEKARQEAEERKARGEEEPKPLTIEQIQQRTKERRAHLAALRDDMQKYAQNAQSFTQSTVDSAKTGVQNAPSSAATVGRNMVSNASKPEVVKARWKSFATLGVSLSAVVLFLRKIVRR